MKGIERTEVMGLMKQIGLTVAFMMTSLAAVGCSGSKRIAMSDFGTVDGKPVKLYTLENANGLVLKITDYGGIITDFYVPDPKGKMADIVLGFDTVDEYVKGSPYFGAMVGRVGNRIAKAQFELDGKTYKLAANNGPNHLHGGVKGFDKVIWKAEPADRDGGPALKLTYVSPDGDEGYPGELTATVVYQLTNENELVVDITATTNKATPVNIVHHTYWNLGGHNSGSILDHELTLNASKYTPADDTLIPTGKIDPVAGTPYDFTKTKAIGKDIKSLPDGGPDNPQGYDLNYAVDGDAGKMRLAATVVDPKSGRVMTVSSDQPGVQFYSGNFLGKEVGKGGTAYKKHFGFCLETQYYPDSINKIGTEGWANPVLKPGQTYRHTMVHKFSTK